MERNKHIPKFPIYRTRAQNRCSLSCTYCPDIGALSKKNKSLDEIDINFEKAKRGNYKSISLSCSDLNAEWFQTYAERTKADGLDCIFQIHPDKLKDIQKHHQHILEQDHIYLLINISANQHIDRSITNTLSQRSLLLYIANKESNKSEEIQWLQTLPQEKLFFYFSPKINEDAPFLDPKEIFEFTQAYKAASVNLSVKTLPSFDLYDSRISEQVELQPILKPQLASTHTFQNQPQVSVIIPTFNSIQTLIPTIESVLKQNLQASDYEIIIADDGSIDATKPILESWLRSREEKIQLRFYYFYIKRDDRKNKRGTFYFHPGVARNIGANASTGKFLLFMDSDIILPPDYLEKAIRLSKHYDFIQPKRLNFRAPNQMQSYKDIEKNAFLEEADNAFLNPLLKNDWNDLDNKWKYVCTYCLFLSRELFYKVGPFRNSFCSYGHEDTELGYRHKLAGSKFYFIKEPVFHYAPEKQRSEYENSYFKKRKLFFHSAQTFYCLHPDPEVFYDLKWIWPSNRKNPVRWALDESSKAFDGFRKLLRTKGLMPTKEPAQKATIN